MEIFLAFFQDPLAQRFIYVGIGLIVILLIRRLINRMLNNYITDNSSRYQAHKFVTVIGYIFFVLLVMYVFNYRFQSITLALGVAGAGIAFALQEVIVSVAGFLAILTGKFYKVGNRVKLGGIKGDVVDIGILRTTIMEMGDWVDGDLYNGRVVRVANSFIFKEPVFNYSGEFPFLWDEIKIPLKHSSDYEFAKESFKKIAETELGDFAEQSKKAWTKLTQELYIENARVEPMINLSFDENWITFTLRYIVDYKRRRATKDILFTRILQQINQSDGQLQIASIAFEITAFPSHISEGEAIKHKGNIGDEKFL